MSLPASQAASDAIDLFRARQGALRKARHSRTAGLAVGVLAGSDVEIALDSGQDDLTEDIFFQIGSVTKTMTSLLLADCVVRGETSLDTTVKSVLGAESGNCGEVTLGDLVTQHSGLPRLPPGWMLRSLRDPKDPYASFLEQDLLNALRKVERPSRAYGYSNFGFMLLGLLLARITGTAFGELLKARVFEVMGMSNAVCAVPAEEKRVPGYVRGSPTPWWQAPLPGAGGVSASIRDLSRYLVRHLSPPEALREQIDLVLQVHAPGPPVMGMGWMHLGGGHWHNGATGGFHSFVAIHRATHSAIALLANAKETDFIDAVGVEVLTKLVRSRQ